MPEPRACDVVIVGAGIAGSALALALAGRGLSIAVVEAQPVAPTVLPLERDVASFDSRVSALTPRSRDFLQSIGAWDAISGYRLCAYRHMTVWDADGTGQIEFDCAEVDAGLLGYIVENRAVVASLLERIATRPDIHLCAGAGLQACERDEAGALHIELENGSVLQANLLALPGETDSHLCSIVWSIEEEHAADLLALDDAAFCAQLGRASEYCLGDILNTSARVAVPLRQRHAVDYVQPGVALVADAAHTIHPLAGQGINLGLADVAVLAEEVARGHALGLEPGELALLRRYQRRRKADNLLMMSAMEGFKRLFAQRSPGVRWLRNAGMSRLDTLQPLKRQIMRHAMGLG